jgi:NarL family two-component system sensor histidine kinase LiaS
VLGVMILTLAMPSFIDPQFMGQVFPGLLASVAAFTLFAGLVGSVFGYFTARGLTRRLERVSAASDAWSRGDFSKDIPDAAPDELGALARRLNSMARELRNLLTTRQELAALEERNRIARELHDSVKQQVFAASMQLGAARALISDPEDPAAKRLEEAQRLTAQAQNELNALIHQLRPVALEGKGLPRALRDLAESWSRQTGIAVQFETANGAASGAGQPMEQVQALYRIAQEALANVARHSKASRVDLRLECAGERARMTITDDGQGFDLLHAPEGVGLQSMRERVEALGGRLTVTTAPCSGTRVDVEL